MKKLYIHLLFLLLFFSINPFFSFGQILALTNQDESITITPQGIRGKSPNINEPSNTMLGRAALSTVINGTQNTAAGDKTLFNNKLSQNTAGGYMALFSNTFGTQNSAFGANALENNTTGSQNIALGVYALNNNTTLSSNIAVGNYALFSQDYAGSLSENIAIGHSALYNNNPTDSYNGRQNLAIGNDALYTNNTGVNNIAIGHEALYSAKNNDDNLAIGHHALWSNIIGSKNVAIGSFALANNNGSGNIAIGYKAGYNLQFDNRLYIANSETDSPLIGGDFSANKLAINRDMLLLGANDFRIRSEALQVGGDAFKTTGTANWKFVSDRRLKKNIHYLNSQEILVKLLKMQGVTYQILDEKDKETHYGFIAQDLREIFPDKIKENSKGYLSADYGSYDAIVIEAIKALYQNIEKVEVSNSLINASYEKTLASLKEINKRMEVLKK